jgi:DNA recombination protein RmuC
MEWSIFYILIITVVALVLLNLAILIVTSKRGTKLPSDKLIEDFAIIKNTVQKISGDLFTAQRVIDNISTSYEARKKIEENISESIRKIEHVIAGTKHKGLAGENILRESLKSFPADMVVHNLNIRGKQAEFGLKLPNGKVIPIDSKWTSSALLDELANEKNLELRQRLILQIERETLNRANEVTQYIDPNLTVPFAIMAVPDSVFVACKSAHIEAFKKKVIILPYSQSIPYLLSLYNLYLQFSQEVDIDNLKSHLQDLRRHLDEMDLILENKIIKAATMIENAAQEYRQKIGIMKGSLMSLKAPSRNKDKS